MFYAPWNGFARIVVSAQGNRAEKSQDKGIGQKKSQDKEHVQKESSNFMRLYRKSGK